MYTCVTHISAQADRLREENTSEDRLSLRKSVQGDGQVEPAWWSDPERSGGMEIVFLDAYVNTWLCVLVCSCVLTQVCACRVVFFCACSGHTCMSLFVCLGCHGLDALSLFPSYLQEDMT